MLRGVCGSRMFLDTDQHKLIGDSNATEEPGIQFAGEEMIGRLGWRIFSHNLGQNGNIR